jgi:general secretion pathway protein E
MQSDASVKAVQIAEALVREAMSRRATHIHLESLGQAVHIRLRIDGVLHDVSDWQVPPQGPADAGLVSQFMSLAGLDEARHLPQFDRFRMALAGKAVDLRMDSCPTARGLRAVIAILDPAEVAGDLSRLGLDRPEQMDLRRLLRQPCGMIVLAGRPGPLRNEAMQAMTASADLRGRSVVMVGRSGLMDSPGLTVVGAKSQDGLSFAQAIGTFARQDADVIACEDLRDPPAAVAALDAAEAGKLVLAGINSPTAASAVGTLFDMGLEPWPLAANLLAVIAYTRIRTLCSDCKQPAAPDGQLLELLGLDPAGDRFASLAAAGCPRCSGSGYAGTMGLLSVMMVDTTVAPAIRAGLAATELDEAARTAGFKDLRHIGLEKVRAGLTSLEELARILPS